MADGSGPARATGTGTVPAGAAFLLRLGFRDGYVREAQARAAHLGVGVAEIVAADGFASEDEIYAALAAHLGIPLADLAVMRLAPDVVSGRGVAAALATRTVMLESADGTVLGISPRGREVERLARSAARRRGLFHRAVLIPPARLDAALLTQAGAALVARLDAPRPGADRAAHAARDTPRRVRAAAGGLIASVLAALAAGAAIPGAGEAIATAVTLAGCVLFALALGLRVVGLATPPPQEECTLLSDAALPRVTVLVPLYDEARLVAQSMRALERLDYPRAKLEILVLVEARDAATRAALERFPRAPHVGVLVLPPGGPATKPRALQLGLLFARGRYVTVFDAEDVPDPGQLRRAAAAFARAPGTACLQARLDVEDAQGWLARQFALEYAALFHVLVPGLARLGLPVLLGGTSNHFDTAMLRAAGGWDAWNVTEDADLGVRLARDGRRVGVLASSTVEEAPGTLRDWLGQRRRWMKGFMQTALAHLADGPRLTADLGWRGTAGLAGTLGATLVAALAYPLALVSAGLIAAGAFGPAGPVTTAALVVFAAGHVVPAAAIVAGARRAGLAIGPLALVTLPVTWCLISVATVLALVDLVRRPFHWVKTPHRGRAAAAPVFTGARAGSLRPAPGR